MQKWGPGGWERSLAGRMVAPDRAERSDGNLREHGSEDRRPIHDRGRVELYEHPFGHDFLHRAPACLWQPLVRLRSGVRVQLPQAERALACPAEPGVPSTLARYFLPCRSIRVHLWRLLQVRRVTF